jgi:hypothetical protein
MKSDLTLRIREKPSDAKYFLQPRLGGPRVSVCKGNNDSPYFAR